MHTAPTWGDLAPPDPRDQITIGMASIPERQVGMERTLHALLPQCDQFDVYLNRYPAAFSVPLFHDPKVNVFHGPNDIGARGKFYMAHRTAGYFLTVDDDLVYPDDYVSRTVQGIEKYRREAIVGYHGVTFVQNPDELQPQGRMLFSHAAELPMDLPVHMLGTGLFAYHSDTTQFDWRNMEEGKIDEQVALTSQARRLPSVCLAHPDDWVTEDDDLKFLGALRRNLLASKEAIARQQYPWSLYLPNSWKEHQRFP